MNNTIKQYSTFIEHDSNEYMFFQNLMQIQKDVEAILSMDKSAVSKLLNDGHAWAVDHISTSKDDIEEVTNWLSSKL